VRWWLTPYWSKENVDPLQHVQMRNRRGSKPERVRTPPLSCAGCGYYEWTKNGERNLPYYGRPREDDGMLVAGVWDR
jgi:putative SOS response-associated peptidase YedK